MSDTDRPVLVVQDVHLRHGSGDAAVTALAGVDLQVRPGELVAVMGPSGSGKSSLLQVAGGLARPDRGRVEVEEHLLGALTRTGLAALRRRSIGYVFQELNLVSTLTLAENVALPLELDGARRRDVLPRAVAALAQVGVDRAADRFPDEVSGGQRQRAAIARALVGERRLLLADEPTGALDTATGDDVMAVLRDRVDAGAAAVLVTHDSRHASWADRVVLLRDGRVVDDTGLSTAGDPAQALGSLR